MKVPKALSPTSLHLWESDREAFYLKYMSGVEKPDQAQTLAMAVGSAFDAHVKSELVKHLYSEVPPEYELEAMLEEQVDAEIIPAAREAGKYVFDCYYKCGAYSELLDLLCRSTEPPRFEFKITREIGGVPLVGKPDCWFMLNGGQVVLDWKVNGYCSTSPTSPKKLYSYCRDTWSETEGKPTRGGDGPHKSFDPMEYCGTLIGKHYLEDVDHDWADQLAIYTWMLGTPVGSETVIACIDQIAAKPGDPLPLLRVAQHRCRLGSFWQHSLLGRLQDCWRTVTSGHIFTEMSKEESVARCELLDDQARLVDDDPFWALVNQKGYKG